MAGAQNIGVDLFDGHVSASSRGTCAWKKHATKANWLCVRTRRVGQNATHTVTPAEKHTRSVSVRRSWLLERNGSVSTGVR